MPSARTYTQVDDAATVVESSFSPLEKKGGRFEEKGVNRNKWERGRLLKSKLLLCPPLFPSSTLSLAAYTSDIRGRGRGMAADALVTFSSSLLLSDEKTDRRRRNMLRSSHAPILKLFSPLPKSARRLFLSSKRYGMLEVGERFFLSLLLLLSDGRITVHKQAANSPDGVDFGRKTQNSLLRRRGADRKRGNVFLVAFEDLKRRETKKVQRKKKRTLQCFGSAAAIFLFRFQICRCPGRVALPSLYFFIPPPSINYCASFLPPPLVTFLRAVLAELPGHPIFRLVRYK